MDCGGRIEQRLDKNLMTKNERKITTMSTNCPAAPADKKEYLTDIGQILVREYGTKMYYKTEEVEKAHKKSKWYEGLDFSCWGMSTFSSHEDFDRHHEATGEHCDYAEMKSEMLNGLSISDGYQIFENMEIDASWLDFGEVFGIAADGLGQFVAGIFDGI